MVDLCNFLCVGDCKDRLIINSIVAGLSSTKAYQQCISKGSSLTLNECIKICQTRCNMQTCTSPSTRVCRLHRQYTNTQNSSISTTVSQTKLQGQRRLQRPAQRWQIQPHKWHGRSLALERLQTQYWDCMWILWLMAPQIRRRVQGLTSGMLLLWKTQTFLKSMQTQPRLSESWKDCNKTHQHWRTAYRLHSEWVHNPILCYKWTSKSSN